MSAPYAQQAFTINKPAFIGLGIAQIVAGSLCTAGFVNTYGNKFIPIGILHIVSGIFAIVTVCSTSRGTVVVGMLVASTSSLTAKASAVIFIIFTIYGSYYDTHFSYLVILCLGSGLQVIFAIAHASLCLVACQAKKGQQVVRHQSTPMTNLPGYRGYVNTGMTSPPRYN